MYQRAWSSWCCAQCKSEELFPQLVCKDNGHKLTKKDTVRYKFQCKQCQGIQWSLNWLKPKLGCQCGTSRDGYELVPWRKQTLTLTKGQVASPAKSPPSKRARNPFS